MNGAATLWRLVVTAGVLAVTGTPGAAGQAVRGRVTDAAGTVPLALARVSLVRADGTVAVTTSSDDAGSYALHAGQPGPYRIQVDLLGYQRLESPLLTLEAGQTVSADFELPDDPIELEGLRVEVAAMERVKEELRMFGVRADDLGERFVDRAEIERREVARDFGSVLQWQSIPALSVVRGDDASPPAPVICVKQVPGRDVCALMVLNGALVTPEVAYSIPRESLQAIVVLTPVEATTLYGTDATGGAVLLFTR